nr:MAG TPA: hypothetical protein [Caudoviricetes sp.]
MVSSFRTQYGISFYTHSFQDMRWKEFRALVAGLSSETPLGRIIQIRSEEDPKMLEAFSQGQHRIRNEWRNKRAKERTQAELDEVLKELQKAFAEW